MPDRQSESDWLVRTSLVIIAFVAVAVALIYTRAFMVPFVLAVFIVSIVSPLLDFQVLKLRFPHALAVLISMVAVVAITAIICLLVSGAVQSIVSAAQNLGEEDGSGAPTQTVVIDPNRPLGEQSVESTARMYASDLAKLAERGFIWLEERGVKLDRAAVTNDLQNRVPKLATSFLGTAFGLVSSLLLVTIFVIFLLAGRNPYIIRKGVYADIDQKIRKYVTTKVLLSLATGILVWVALKMIGLRLAGVFGLLAFMLNFIPSLGSIVSTLLPIPVAVAQFDSYLPIALAVLIPGAVQMSIGNVIEPKVMGEGLNLHPVTILLALSFWGLLWGVVGMLLAAPMTAVIRIVLMQFETLRPFGNLLAGQLPEPVPEE